MGQTLNIADKVTRAAMPVCITRRLTRPPEAAMHVYRGLYSSLFRLKLVYKQEHKVSYRCSLPSPLQKGSKDWEVLIRLIHKCEIR